MMLRGHPLALRPYLAFNLQATMAGVPVIRTDVDELSFRYREAGTSGDTLLGTLAGKIKQQRLSRADKDAITRCI